MFLYARAAYFPLVFNPHNLSNSFFQLSFMPKFNSISQKFINYLTKTNYMKKIYLLLVVALYATISHAQVTGTKTIGTDYATIAAAVTALNTSGVGAGGATINIPAAYTETAPSGGIVLGSTALNASLSATNTLKFVKTGTGVNPAVTAFTGGTSATDGIFKIAGSDYVTIDGLDLKENAANTGTALMEWGYALVNLNAAAPFDGVQNTTIKNCAVTLNKTNANATICIYGANNTAASATALTLTAAGDVHSSNKFYTNTLANAAFGFFIGNLSATAPAATLFGQGNDIGGTTAATGNTLSNMGNVTGFNAFGIYAVYQTGVNVSNNTIADLTAVSGTALTYGIYMFAATGTSTTNGNNITLSQSAATGAVAGIYAGNTGDVTATGNTIKFTDPAGSATHYGIYSASVGTNNISTNTLKATNTGAATGTYYFIYHASTAANGSTINGNVFDNINTSTTATVYLIYSSNSTLNITSNNNSILGGFTKSGAGGTVYGYYNFGSPGSGTATLTGNNYSNVTLTGATGFYGIYQATGTGQVEILTNNTVSNVTTGAGTAIALYHSYGAAGSLVNGNIVSGITCAGTLTAIQVGNTAPGGIGVYNNTISNLNSTGASVVTGILYAGGTNGLIYKNKISGLTGNNAGASVYGLTISAGTTSVSAYNNLIGDLKAPATTSTTDAIRGINITTTTAALALGVYNNTVNINATSSGANFSTSALYATTSATATSGALTLRNNILWNGSTPKGTGFTSAYRRSSTTLTNYAAASNNNLFFAGAGCTNNALYYDGTTGYNTIGALQTALAPRESASKTELATPFVTTTGVAATFLHLAGTTVAEGGGASIATVTDDYDGDVRSATTPDIGADEFAGTAPAACSGTPTAGTITGNVNVCQGLSNTLTLTGFSNTSGIAIQWQSATTSGGPYTNIACATGATLQTGVITPGTTVYYVAVVTCGNGGATATTPQFTLTSFATPTITVTPATATICTNTSVSLTASGAATYAWAPATGLSAATGATVTANPAATTVYTVTGTTTQGCVSTGTATVNVNPAPTVTSVTTSAAAICPGATVTLSATANTNVPVTPVSVLTEGFEGGAIPTGWVSLNGGLGNLWYVPQTLGTARTGAGAAEYRWNTANAANAYLITKAVTLTAGTTYTVSSWYRGTSTIFPENLKITVGTAQTVAGQTTILQSIPGITSATYLQQTTTYTPTVSGTYYFAWNCYSAADEFYLDVDDILITSPAAPATLNYSWTSSPAGFTSTSQNPTASPTVTTVYTVTATNPATGCAATGTVTVNVNAVSVAPTSATASTTSICGTSGTVSLTAVGGTLGTGASYKWYTGSCGGTLIGTGATLSNVFLNQTTTYYVRAEGTCNNTTCASVTVSVNPVPQVVLTAANGSVNPVATNPSAVTNLTATVSPAGNYVYSWTLNGAALPVLTSSITPANGLFNAFGTYQVTVTNVASGCTATSNTIAVTDIAGERDRLFIRPNPTSGIIYVSYYSSTPAAQARIINVLDSKGSRLMSKAYSTTGAYGQMMLDLSGLVSGVYMIELTDGANKRIKVDQVIKN